MQPSDFWALWPTWISKLARSRLILAGLAALNLGVFLGCMSLSIGGRTYESCVHESTSDGELLIQEGETRLRSHSEQDVFYPVPFAQPPNLNLAEDCDDCVILCQAPDHFRVKNKSLFRSTVHWKAKGMKLTPLPPPPASPSPKADSTSTTTLPPEPVKIP
jgi:hypothetical protein